MAGEAGDKGGNQGDAGDKGGGGDGDKGGGDKGMQEVLNGMKLMTETVSKQQQNIEALMQRVDTLADGRAAGGDGDDDGDDGAGDDDVAGQQPSEKDLEGMSRPQFGKHIVDSVTKGMNKQLEKMIKVLEAKIGKVEETTDRTAVQAAIEKVMEKHPDFYEWTNEIKAVAQDSPGITPKRAYTLARMENPEKAKKMDEKYKDDSGKGEGSNKGPGEQGGKKRTKFGGLTPTSGVVLPNQKMKPREAADKAFDDLLGAGGEDTN